MGSLVAKQFVMPANSGGTDVISSAGFSTRTKIGYAIYLISKLVAILKIKLNRYINTGKP